MQVRPAFLPMKQWPSLSGLKLRREVDGGVNSAGDGFCADLTAGSVIRLSRKSLYKSCRRALTLAPGIEIIWRPHELLNSAVSRSINTNVRL
jgi:hypothetical protein